MDKCGDCIHARVVPDNLQHRICRGAPPQVIATPLQNGSMQIRHMFPTVLATDETCGQFKYKNVIDHINGEVVE